MSTVLQFQDVSKAYGLKLLFDQAGVAISEGQKIGFIGRNGSGKTTLVKMILGQESVDSGEIKIYGNTRLGYLEQNETFPEKESVIDYLIRVSGREPWECAKMAGAFEVKHERLEADFLSLSGGYQMRVRLAAVLVRDPNLLVLDEPTNYLDLQTILLLEEVLKTFRGALLLISHDREFLKNVCDYTLELENKKLNLFHGDIETFLADKEQRLEDAKRYNKKIRAKQAHLKEFVDRFRYKASLASQAQSKLKQIEKLKTIEIAHSARRVRIDLPHAPQRNAEALHCKDLAVGYLDGKPVLSHIDFEINRGDHLAVLGENGQGKSTLLKTLACQLASLSGAFKFGYNLRIAYYAQHVPAMLPTQGTVGTYLASTTSSSILPEELLRMAGNFLFTKDDLDKPLSVLSGGERARLCLAGICLGSYDVLLLDEPTNHLDFDTVEALGEALGEYEGTIIFVSHDRTFVSEIATNILEISDGTAKRYPYPYDLYVYEQKTHERVVIDEIPATSQILGAVPFVRPRAEIHADISKQKHLLKKLDGKLQSLTGDKNDLLDWFGKNPTAIDIDKTKRLKELDAEIIDLEHKWFDTGELLQIYEKELVNRD